MTRSIVQLYHKYVHKKAMLRVLHCDAPARKEIGITIPVRITNVKVSWGKEYILVSPLNGVGSTWVEAGSNIEVVELWPHEKPGFHEMCNEADAEANKT